MRNFLWIGVTIQAMQPLKFILPCDHIHSRTEDPFHPSWSIIVSE